MYIYELYVDFIIVYFSCLIKYCYGFKVFKLVRSDFSVCVGDVVFYDGFFASFGSCELISEKEFVEIILWGNGFVGILLMIIIYSLGVFKNGDIMYIVSVCVFVGIWFMYNVCVVIKFCVIKKDG